MRFDILLCAAMAKVKKMRLDSLLLEKQLLADLKTAQGLILSGRVVVDERVCAKPGTLVREDAEINIRGVILKYASRGGYKLEAAYARFPISVAGRVVLDGGASTGGFTDCSLQHGAARVYAVDVGYGQLRGKLAADPRVVNMEKTNIGELKVEHFDPPVDLATFDLSYLSITKAAPQIASVFRGPAEMIGLVKPLYEGVAQEEMTDTARLSDALYGVGEGLSSAGLQIVDLIVSPIFGGGGSVEFLAWIKSSEISTDPQFVARAIEELKAHPPKAEPI